MTYVDGIILGAVQGLTEFLPVSSSAHLAIAQNWLGLAPDGLPMHVFDGISHVATVLAIFIVFYRSFYDYLSRLLLELSTGWKRERHALRFTLLGVVASIPTAAIGLAFKKHFEESFGSPAEVGGGLIVTGALLLATSHIPRPRKGIRQFQWWHAGLVGIAQGVSISPGVSRSGATICTATLCGIRRRWAAEFSFFIAIPAIIGATIVKLREVFHSNPVRLPDISWGPTIAGAAVALVIGVVSLKLLLSAVRTARLHYFAGYCILLGALVIARVV